MLTTKPNPTLSPDDFALTPRAVVEQLLARATGPDVMSHSATCRIVLNQAKPRGAKGHLFCIGIKGQMQYASVQKPKADGYSVRRYELSLVPDPMAPETLPPMLRDVLKGSNRGEPIIKMFTDPPQYLDTYEMDTASFARDLLTDFATLTGIVRLTTWLTRPGAENWDGPVATDAATAPVAAPKAAPVKRKIRVLD